MPSYVYKCEEGHQWVITHSINEDPEIYCDFDDKPAHRVPQVVPTTFHTDGFYTTDKHD